MMKKVKFVGPSEAFTPFGVMKPGEVIAVDEKHFDLDRVLRGQFILVEEEVSKKKKEAVGKKIAPAVPKSKEE